MTTTEVAELVDSETVSAYRDAHGTDAEMEYACEHETRNLRFRGRKMNAAYWLATMLAAIEHGYNRYDAKAARYLAGYFHDAQFVPAREGSVCVYIYPATQDLNLVLIARRTRADEVEMLPDGSLRIWWD